MSALASSALVRQGRYRRTPARPTSHRARRHRSTADAIATAAITSAAPAPTPAPAPAPCPRPRQRQRRCIRPGHAASCQSAGLLENCL